MKRSRQRRDDKEEEYLDRKNSLRKRKRIKYIEINDDDDDDDDDDNDDDDDDDDGDDDDEKGEGEDQEDNEQPVPSTQNTHNKGTQKNRILPITCRNKKGTLDAEKLSKGELCIQCEGRWFSPSAFEIFSGRGASKKWKATIYHENKPLQTLFDEGILSTNGYKRKSYTMKPKKILSSDLEPESSSEASEVQSTEETEEDNVQDDNWPPGSEELVAEMGEEEKEKEESDDGGETVDSEDDYGEEDEDKMEKGELKDEDGPSITDYDNENNDFEEMDTHLSISAVKKNALKSAIVVLKKLGECVHQSIVTEHSEDDSWCKPLDEDTQTERERQHSSSAIDASYITAVTQTNSWQMSDALSIISVKAERDGRNEDGQTEIPNEKGNPLRPLSAPATSSKPDTDDKPEDTGSGNNHTANLSPSSVTVTSTGFSDDVMDNWEEKEDGVLETENCATKEKEQKRLEHLDTSSCEASIQPSANVNIRNETSNTVTTERGIEDESIEAMSRSTKPLSDTDAATCDHDGAQLQVMNQNTRDPQKTRAANTYSSDTERSLSSRCSTSINLDAMDLEQLKREKIKMQLKVLKLQEKYYHLKIREFKK